MTVPWTPALGMTVGMPTLPLAESLLFIELKTKVLDGSLLDYVMKCAPYDKSL